MVASEVWLLAFLIGVLLLFGLLIFVLVALITALISFVRYQVYRAQALADAEDELDALGWNLDADEVFRTAFGIEELSSRKSKSGNGFDWFTGTILGDEDEAA